MMLPPNLRSTRATQNHAVAHRHLLRTLVFILALLIFLLSLVVFVATFSSNDDTPTLLLGRIHAVNSVV